MLYFYSKKKNALIVLLKGAFIIIINKPFNKILQFLS